MECQFRTETVAIQHFQDAAHGAGILVAGQSIAAVPPMMGEECQQGVIDVAIAALFESGSDGVRGAEFGRALGIVPTHLGIGGPGVGPFSIVFQCGLGIVGQERNREIVRTRQTGLQDEAVTCNIPGRSGRSEDAIVMPIDRQANYLLLVVPYTMVDVIHVDSSVAAGLGEVREGEPRAKGGFQAVCPIGE